MKQKRLTFGEYWFRSFPIGLFVSLLIVAIDVIYILWVSHNGDAKEPPNGFFNLLALSILNLFITPMLCAFALTLKGRLNMKFSFRQTYKFQA